MRLQLALWGLFLGIILLNIGIAIAGLVPFERTRPFLIEHVLCPLEQAFDRYLLSRVMALREQPWYRSARRRIRWWLRSGAEHDACRRMIRRARVMRDYSAARAKAIEQLGDRYLLATPINNRKARP